MKTLILKLAEEPYSISPIDTFDYLKKFGELYELLKIGNVSAAKKIYDSLGNTANVFPEYLKSKPEDVLPLFTKLVQLEKFENILKSGIGSNIISAVIKAKEIMFPASGALFDPEEMSADTVDFFMDENMWSWIESASKRKLTDDDLEAIDIITASVKDLLAKGILL